ncbi:MAG: PDZ domain-containing protein, partial [Oscillospiraceae bacterium]|nr:PDZ domain-containing protein [Oscillospiraceae bacterium]
MSFVISSVEKNSPAEKAGILPGESIVSINGNVIKDVLDYRFYMIDSSIKIEIIGLDGKHRTVSVKKPEYDDLGLDFETYLMDKERCCKNKCIFCFIDQMPPNMRETLYFKDDDSRLGFLFGNYITMTNLED